MRKKMNKKGFTLVEIIVVLVILAILAAIMIPAMTGWIDKANEKAVIVEARAALLACQTLASESYGEDGAPSVDVGEAKTLAGVPGTISGVGYSGTLVNAMIYTGTTYKATWNGSTWTTVKN